MSGWAAEGATFFDADDNARRPSIEVSFAGELADIAGVQVQVRRTSTSQIVFDAQLPYDPADVTPSIILNGLFLPDTEYEARGRFLPFSGRETSWGSWDVATTPDVRIGTADIAVGSITASLITAGAVTAEKISAGTITANEIIAAGITELTANTPWTGFVNASGTPADVGNSLVIDVPSGAGVVIFAIVSGGPSSDSGLSHQIYRDGGALGELSFMGPQIAFSKYWNQTNTLVAVDYPAAGSRTYTVRHARSSGSGTVTTTRVTLLALMVRR
jgi:hypothetical protein